MANPAPLRIAVIGRNVSAALCAAELSRYPQLRVSWYQTQKDRLLGDSSQWLMLPPSYVPQDFRTQLGEAFYKVRDPFLFYDHTRRVPLSLFLRGKIWPNLHIAVRRRLIALGLWSDSTPRFWNKKVKPEDREPNLLWPFSEPISLKVLRSPEVILVQREKFLSLLERRLQAGGVELRLGSLSVLGVQIGYRSEHKLLHNSPYGFSGTDSLLWTSVASSLKEEASEKKFQLNHKTPKAAGRWRSAGAWIDSSSVTGLPPFSLWLDHGLTQDFLSTGFPFSGFLKRVIAVHSSDMPGKTWLQIKELEMKDLPLAEESERPDRFLWELCPLLKNAIPDYETTFSEEHYFYDEPTPVRHDFGKNIHQWIRGSLGDPSIAMKEIFKV